ncbi:unnamed protein product [Sphagnum jensenii]|uniref:Uncharacterized protein n=1 Tax=Sphagnum jensenii TaxID=128206 RepID=A0ABP0V8H4_9BRYO
MAYTPFLPNQFDQNLIPVEIRSRYFEEYLGLTPFTAFMGSSPEDAIQIFETNNGEGLSYRVSFRKDLNYQSPIIGFDQAAGAEQPVQIFEDEISLQLRRFVDVLMGVPIVRKATPIDVYGTLRPLLLNAQRRNLVLSLLNAACGSPAVGGLYISALAGGNGPTVDRVIYAAAGGGSPASYNAVINTAVNNMGVVGAAGSGLSVAHLRALKTYAFAEDRPWNGNPNDNQPEGISGARYRGMAEGVMVYECPELSRYAVTRAAGLTSALIVQGLDYTLKVINRILASSDNNNHGDIGTAAGQTRDNAGGGAPGCLVAQFQGSIIKDVGVL